MSDLASHLKHLPAEMRDGFLRQLQRTTNGQGDAVLQRRDLGLQSLPSFQQEQMWFVDKLGGAQSRNNIGLRIDLRGRLDVPALERTVGQIVRRHDVLHSRLIERDGGPLNERVPAYLPAIDHVDLTEDPAEDALRAVMADRLAVAFDLAAAPPLALSLIRLRPDHHVLLWVCHHVIWDPRSTALLATELAEQYADDVNDRFRAHTGSSPIRYADFAAWQRDRLGDDERASLRQFWIEELAGVPATEVPTDRPRTLDTNTSGRGIQADLPAEVTAQIEALAAECETTLFTVLLSAFAVVLSRWTGEEDVVVGTASARRPHRDLAGVMGCFVEMVPLRIQPGSDRTFRQVLADAQTTVADAFAHCHLPFEQIVDAVRPPRDALRHPIFQIEMTSVGEWDTITQTMGAELRLELAQVHDGAAKFDLSMIAGTIEGRLRLWLEFNTDLYRESTARSLLDATALVVQQVAADPDRVVSDVRFLDDEGVALLVGELTAGGPPVEGARQRSICDAFDDVVTRQPDAVAVRDADCTWTYARLAAHSRTIAARVLRAGAVPGDRIGLVADRSGATVAAMLGVLRAGCAYVPLPTDGPAARSSTIIVDAGIRLLVGEDLEVAMTSTIPIPGPVDAPPLPVGLPAVTGSDVAYVLFTSGSSGTPKGVVIEHGSVVHFCAAIAEAYAITPGDRVLHAAALTFDVSVFEVFAALLSGAQLVVADREVARDPSRLTQLMSSTSVTVAELPPAMLPLMEQADLPDLRLLSVGGEPFPGTLVAQWQIDGRRFVNGYGPTECTVAVTLKECTGAYATNPPIGRPMAGHQALVLDAALEPVPIGMPGELCIAGSGVARGYLNRPELTADRFRPNPFAGHPWTQILYRTGDRVRWRPDGDLEFLGRIDQQMKIRGFRVEPGEVEAVLESAPGVGQAVVELKTSPNGEAMLVGYVTPVADAVPDADAIRAHARDRLPAYMVPIIHLLPTLPRTRSGKVDRRGLPTPDLGGGTHDGGVCDPLDEVEAEILGEVVEVVLGHPIAGVAQDFFAAGGSSLQATTIVARVRERFDVDISLAEFFAEPTVAELARRVRAAREERAEEDRRMLAILDQVEHMSDEEAATMLASLQTEEAEQP